METSRGIGVAVIVEKTGDNVFDVLPSAAGVSPVHSAPHTFIRIDDVELTFDARPRDDNVTV